MQQSATKNLQIWNIVKPYYWVLRFFGLAPFSIRGDIKNGIIKTGISDVLYMLVALIIQSYVLYINITIDLSLSRTSSFLIDRGAFLIEIFNAGNVLIGTCFYAICRKRIWRIFRNCYEFDGEVIVNDYVPSVTLIDIHNQTLIST